MDAIEGLKPAAKSDDSFEGALITDLLTWSEVEQKLRLQCTKNSIPHGAFEPGHFYLSQVLPMVEWELLSEREKDDAEGLPTTSGCPGNAGGLPVHRPFSRAEAAMLRQAGIISAADMNPPPRLADEIEAEGNATPSRTSGGAGETGAPSTALHTAAPTHAQDAGRATSARAMADLNANIVTGAAVQAHRERLIDEFPKTSRLLRLGLDEPLSMDRRSIVAVASYGHYLERHKKAIAILRKSIDLSVHRA